MIARFAALALALAPQAPASDLFWSDWDRDGDLDALVTLPDGSVRLLGNEGPAGFADVTAAAGLSGQSGVSAALWGDFDLDRQEDLVLVGAGGVRLLKQAQGVFADATGGSGLEALGPTTGAEWVDADGDGRLDLHLSVGRSHRVFVSVAAGAYEERSFAPMAEAPSSGGTSAPLASTASAVAIGTPAAPPAGEERPRTMRSSPGAPGASGSRVQAPPSGPQPAVEPPSGGSINLAYCPTGISDYSLGGCLNASSVPILGQLYPLSLELFVNAATGYVGVGTTSPLTPLDVRGGSAISPPGGLGGGYLRVGSPTTSLVMDEANIQGELGGAANDLHLNPFGGDVQLGDWSSAVSIDGALGLGTAPQTQLHVKGLSEVSAAPDTGIVQLERSFFGASLGIDTDEIQARSAGTASSLFLNPHGGNVGLGFNTSVVYALGTVGVGTALPGTPLHIEGADDVVLAKNSGLLQLMDNTGRSMGLDSNEIQARDSFGASALLVNPYGGDVRLGDANSSSYTLGRLGVGVSAPAVKAHIAGGSDASLGGGGYVVAGPVNGLNLVFDSNEIMARHNGSSSLLALNYDGGDVRIGDAGSSVYAYGKIGAGTGAPDVRVHAIGGGDASPAGGGYVQAGPTGGFNLVFDDNEIMARSNGAIATLSLNYDGGLLQLGNSSSVTYVRGNLGVGTSNPSERLQVAGNVKCTSLIQTSDERFKREVRGLEGALEAVLALRGVSYEWDTEAFAAGDPGRKLGFLAQELREVLPEAVNEDDDGYLAVSYSSVVPVLVEAVSEQQASIEELRAELAELRGLLAVALERTER